MGEERRKRATDRRNWKLLTEYALEKRGDREEEEDEKVDGNGNFRFGKRSLIHVFLHPLNFVTL